MVIYREFKEQDAEEVYKLAKKAWYATYKDIFDLEFINNFVNRAYAPTNLVNTVTRIKAGWTGFWIASDDDRVIGFAQVGYQTNQKPKEDQENEIYLYRIYIDPDYLGQGVGSKLLEQVEDWVRNENKNEYGCYCHKKNELGKAFYRNKEFEHVPERDNIEENEIFLRKKLA